MALSPSLAPSSVLLATSGLRRASDFLDHLRLTGEPLSKGTRDKLSEDLLAMKCRMSTGLRIRGELQGEH